MRVQDEIGRMLVKDGALLDGHFRLRSNKHSSKYLQCALVYQFPEDAERIARLQAGMLAGTDVDVVIAPATGGIVAGYELARALGCRGIFAERVDDRFTLRRGFSIDKGEKVVVAEDVITTGGAVQEVIDLVGGLGGEVTAVAVVVNRTGGNPFDVPLHYLYEFEAPVWDPEDCPLCREGVPIEKPGSRKEVAG